MICGNVNLPIFLIASLSYICDMSLIIFYVFGVCGMADPWRRQLSPRMARRWFQCRQVRGAARARRPSRGCQRSASRRQCGHTPSQKCAACSNRIRTTVLATGARGRRRTQRRSSQPSVQAKPTPSNVATAICATAPGSTTARTDIGSLSEKCRPTANIRRTRGSRPTDWRATGRRRSRE
jgi:hypothetical protein